jgi:hypothetical protein
LELLKTYHDPQTSITAVNDYFANVWKNLVNNIPKNDTCPLPINKMSPKNSMVLLHVMDEEIEGIIKNLRDDCAVGWDGVSAKVLKMSCATITPILTYIFNLAISSGTFPDALKKAVVHPIFKSGDRRSVDNYRPISVLSTLSKILERIMNRSLVSFLESNKTISENQFGFRKGRSTEDAISSLVEHVVKSMDAKQKCLAIFLDLSRAFDTVPIPLLLCKLEAVGVRGNVLSLFKSYLTDRKQCTKIDSQISPAINIDYGVPQGSIISPTLFQIYVNDLCTIDIPHCRLFAYADDTALVVSGSDWAESVSSSEQALVLVLSWLRRNLLTLNAQKTYYITFSTRPSLQPDNELVRLRAHQCDTGRTGCSCPLLNRTSFIKYLGVTLDQCLNWHEQLRITAERIRKLIFIFIKLRDSADQSVLKTVYSALCESITTYCIPVWGGGS